MAGGSAAAQGLLSPAGHKLSDAAPPGGFAKGDSLSATALAEYDAAWREKKHCGTNMARRRLEILIQIHAYLIATFDSTLSGSTQ